VKELIAPRVRINPWQCLARGKQLCGNLNLAFVSRSFIWQP